MITDIRTWSTTDGYEYIQIRGWIGKRPIGSFEDFEKVKSNKTLPEVLDEARTFYKDNLK